MRIVKKSCLLAVLTLVLTLPAQAAEDSWLGLVFKVTATGSIFNQTLKTVAVEKVYPGHPSSDAGIREGDLVVEVNDTKVEGGKASDFNKMIRVPVGAIVKFKVVHQNGDIEAISVTAGPRPKKIPD